MLFPIFVPKLRFHNNKENYTKPNLVEILTGYYYYYYYEK